MYNIWCKLTNVHIVRSITHIFCPNRLGLWFFVTILIFTHLMWKRDRILNYRLDQAFSTNSRTSAVKNFMCRLCLLARCLPSLVCEWKFRHSESPAPMLHVHTGDLESRLMGDGGNLCLYATKWRKQKSCNNGTKRKLLHYRRLSVNMADEGRMSWRVSFKSQYTRRLVVQSFWYIWMVPIDVYMRTMFLIDVCLCELLLIDVCLV